MIFFWAKAWEAYLFPKPPVPVAETTGPYFAIYIFLALIWAAWTLLPIVNDVQFTFISTFDFSNSTTDVSGWTTATGCCCYSWGAASDMSWMNWHLIPYGQYPLVLYFLQSLVLYRTETSVLIIIWFLVWANEHSSPYLHLPYNDQFLHISVLNLCTYGVEGVKSVDKDKESRP